MGREDLDLIDMTLVNVWLFCERGHSENDHTGKVKSQVEFRSEVVLQLCQLDT